MTPRNLSFSDLAKVPMAIKIMQSIKNLPPIRPLDTKSLSS